MSILEHINNLIAQKGEGFYCILTINNEVTDIFKVTFNEHHNTLIQTIGNRGTYSQGDIARMIEQEGAGDGFVFLNDIISVPEPTDQQIAEQWGDLPAGYEESENRHFREKEPFGEVSQEEIDKHYTEALKDGNGNDDIETRSTPDLVGRENLG